MTRIPTTTDPRGTRPARIPVPSSQLGAPVRLGNIPFDDVPPSPGGIIGQALAGAVSDLAQAFQDRDKRIQRIRRARQTSAGIKGFRETLAEAEIEASNVDPAQAIDIYDARVAEIRQGIENIDDEVVQASLSIALDEIGTTGRLRIQRDVHKREKIQTRASHNDLANQLAADIDAGRVQLPIAVSSFSDRIGDALISVYSETEAQARKEAATARFVRLEFNRLLREDPGLAAIFIESDPLAQVLPSDESKRRIDSADRALEQREATLAESALDTARTELRAILSQDTDTVSSAAVDESVTSFTEAMPGFPGFRVKGRFLLNKIADADDLKLILLADELMLAATNGDERRVASILPSMPNTADAQAVVTNAKATLARVMKARADADVGAQRLRAAFISGDTSAALPNDQLSLNAFYQGTKARNEDPASVAQFLAEAEKDIPSDLLKDLQGFFDEETLDLPQGLRVLRAVEAVNPSQARRLAEASKNSALATTALTMTRGLEPISPEYERIVTVLSDPAAEAAMAEAGKRFDGSSSEDIPPFEVGEALDNTFLGDTIISVDVNNEFEAQFRFAFVDLQVTRRETDGKKMTDVAGRIATEAVRDKFVELTVGRDIFFAPSLLGLGSSDRMRSQLQEAVDDFAGGFRTGLFRSASDVRPDLLFVRDGNFYIPATTEFATKAFLEFTPHTEARRVVDATTDPRFFESLNDQFLRRTDRGRLTRNAALQFHPDYGVSSIQGFDLKFFPNNPDIGLRERILRLVEQEWIERTGDVPDLQDTDQLEQFRRLADIKRQELGWPRWDQARDEPQR